MDLSENARADALEAEIQRVQAMPLSELRTLWAARWGAPPRFRSVDLLRRLIAWRLQAEHFGGLDADTKIVLRRSSMRDRPGHRQAHD